MKKLIALILSLLLLLSAAAFVHADEPDFKEFADMDWTFSSGAGAWSNDLQIGEGGLFTGNFHDSEMGESDEAYPGGTIYISVYSGKMSLGEKVDDYAWKVHIDTLTVEGEPEQETIDEGIRFVNTVPYGLSEGDDLLLYRPGTPVSVLPENMRIWAHAHESQLTELDNWFLSNEKQDSGFIAYTYTFDDVAFLPNPWLDISKEELIEVSGIGFNLPEGAEEIVCRYLPDEELSEIQFTLEGDEYCARIQPAAEFTNIADIYLAFENEEKISVGACEGTIGLAKTGSTDWVELCMWYDAAPGIMYSLSVYTTDPDGLDLTAIAEQVYLPMQGDA